jgi:hypothetical protein
MKLGSRCKAMVVFSLSVMPVGLFSQADRSPVLTATAYNSHFPEAAKGGEAWNGMISAHDGTVYYVLSSGEYNVAGQMYSFDPKTKTVTHLADLNDVVGQGKEKAVAQGKSHVNFVEDKGKLYFSTHLGYYKHAEGGERTADAPDGYKPYPGGHFVSFDMATKRFENLAIAPGGDGIITMNMDVQRGRLYGITWPRGEFLTYDLKTRKLKDLGTLFQGGETGVLGKDYRSICRRIVIDPRDGSAYFTTGDGAIHRYHYDTEVIDDVAGASLRKDYFGAQDPAAHGMAYNWRAAVWDPAQNAIFGVNGRSGYLFRFDPDTRKVTVLDRITSEPSKRSGMLDQFDYGYMGFALAKDGHTLYYLTGAPVSGKGTVRGRPRREGCHLVTYDLSSGKYVDHGEVDLEDGKPASAPQSIALGDDGTVYTLSYVTRGGKRGIELISFHP